MENYRSMIQICSSFSAHNEFLERRTYQDMFDRSSIIYTFSGILSKTRTWWLVKALIDRSRKPSRYKNRKRPSPGLSPKSSRLSAKAILPTEVDEMLNHTVGPIDYHRDPEWKRVYLRHYRSNLERMVSIARELGG